MITARERSEFLVIGELNNLILVIGELRGYILSSHLWGHHNFLLMTAILKTKMAALIYSHIIETIAGTFL